ncbi:MAG: acyl-CoA dehydrogenase family protein [Reyranellaceae bacterium]
METEFDEHETRLIEAGRKVAAIAADTALQRERQRQPPREVWDAYRQAGLKGLLVPREMGGHALSARAMARISEAIGRGDPIGALTYIPQEYCMAAIAAYASHPWHREILKTLMAGEKLTGFLLTEPQGGSDAAALRTLARRDGAGWRLDGEKAWVSNAPHIDEHFVFAQTEAGAGAKGIAGFLVPRDAAGLEIGAPYDLLGGHTAAIANVRFNGVRLAAERMAVPPGEGLKAALSAIDLARINVAAMCCGSLQTGLDTALAYVAERRAFGQALAEFQGLQWALAEVATDLHAAWIVTQDAAAALDRNGKASVEAAHAKKFATRAATGGLGQCMAAMGANGLRHDWPVARLFACAKIAESLDGTTEIQNVVIARALLRPYRERMTSS